MNCPITQSGPERYLNLTKEADEIIASNSIKISQTSRYKYEQCFLKHLELRRLLGNHMIPVGVLASLIVGITVFLFLYFFEIEKYWMYILLITCGVILTILIAAFGFRWKRASKSLKRRKMQSWIAKRFLHWSKKQIKNEKNCNKKRLLIENMLNLAHKFVPTDPESPVTKRCHVIIVDILSDVENESAGFLICVLFQKIFKNEYGVYQENGKVVALRILFAISIYTENMKLKMEVDEILEAFAKDTKIDVKFLDLNTDVIDMDQKIVLEKIDIEKNEIDKRLIDYEFFEDLWNLPEDFCNAYRREIATTFTSDSPDLGSNNNLLALLNEASLRNNNQYVNVSVFLKKKAIDDVLLIHQMQNRIPEIKEVFQSNMNEMRPSLRKMVDPSMNQCSVSRINERNGQVTEESMKSMESMKTLLKNNGDAVSNFNLEGDHHNETQMDGSGKYGQAS